MVKADLTVTVTEEVQMVDASYFFFSGQWQGVVLGSCDGKKDPKTVPVVISFNRNSENGRSEDERE